MTTDEISNPPSEEVVLRELYAAINRNNIPAALEFLDPQIERIEPVGFPSAGIYRGHAEVQAHFSQGRGTWAEGSCEPEQFIIADDKIVVFLYVRVRMKDSSEWVSGRLADGFIFRNGKVIQMRSFAERQQALLWAGVETAT